MKYPSLSGFLHSPWAWIMASLFVALTYVYSYQTGETVFNNIGFVVFVAVFLGVFLFLAWQQKVLTHPRLLWLLLPLVILCADLLYFSNEFVRAFAPLAVYALAVLLIMGAVSKQRVVNPFTCQLAGFDLLSAIERALRRVTSIVSVLLLPSAGERPVIRRITIGVLAAIPLIILFTVLFASADALFSQSIDQIFESNNLKEVLRFIGKTILYFLVAGTLFFTALDRDNADSETAGKLKTTDHITLTIVLALLNGLFAVFNYLQLRYVLLGEAVAESFFLERGISYAEYVHQGFFQLVAACAIVAVVIFAFSLFSEKNGRQPLFRAACILLILQTFIVAASALKRMALYQEAYGYTVLRLQVEWFIYFLMLIMLLGFIATVLHRWKWYVVLLFVPTVAAFCVVMSINAEVLVARLNIDRFQAGKQLDTSYILSLSADALPQWQRLQGLSGAEGLQVRDRIKQEQQTYAENKEIGGWRYENWQLKYSR